MAGLVPAIHDLQTHRMRGGWVYILTNKPNGILYTGVARDLARWVWQHREASVAGFTQRDGLKRLVGCEYRDHHWRDSAGENHQTLAASLEGSLDPRR
jgi:putative endonuclease